MMFYTCVYSIKWQVSPNNLSLSLSLSLSVVEIHILHLNITYTVSSGSYIVVVWSVSTYM